MDRLSKPLFSNASRMAGVTLGAAMSLISPVIADDAAAAITPLEHMQQVFPNQDAFFPLAASTPHTLILKEMPRSQPYGAGGGFGDFSHPLDAAEQLPLCLIYSFSVPENIQAGFERLIGFAIEPGVKINAEELALFVFLHELYHCRDHHMEIAGPARMIDELEADIFAINEIKKIYPDSNIQQVISSVRALYPHYPIVAFLKQGVETGSLPDSSDVAVAAAATAVLGFANSAQVRQLMPIMAQQASISGSSEIDQLITAAVVSLKTVISDEHFAGTAPQDHARLYLQAFQFLRPTLARNAENIFTQLQNAERPVSAAQRKQTAMTPTPY